MTFNSIEAFRDYVHGKNPPKYPAWEFKKWNCRKCGKEMRNIAGTNVVLCECGNRILLKR